jgi:hypothetical protein
MVAGGPGSGPFPCCFSGARLGSRGSLGLPPWPSDRAKVPYTFCGLPAMSERAAGQDGQQSRYWTSNQRRQQSMQAINLKGKEYER